MRKFIKAVIICVGLPLWGGETQGAQQDVTVVTVLGAGGVEEYEKKFTEVAKAWQEACKRGGVRLVEVGAGRNEAEKTDRQVLEGVIAEEIERGVSGLWVVLIGHGTFDGRETKFNVRGEDFTDSDLAAWLKPFKGTLVVVNTASSSAPFIKALSGKNRIVITATKSAHEIFYPRFGEYFARAVGGLKEADLDNDEQVSLLEAFLYAANGVKQFFEKEGRIATEHAMLDDNGDQRGIRAESFEGVMAIVSGKEKGGLRPEGERAHQIHLTPNKLEAMMPENLRLRRDDLERQVKALRRKKGVVKNGVYYKELEKLLLEIARIYERVEDGGS
ncbi:MAG: hypothetical protein GXP30_13355 [Verrucomicrobia bacterium]|nr:hypothetical protein [Verrucomicrobiota bacterium]